jgi:hypothetical protein
MNHSIRILCLLLSCLMLGCEGDNRPTLWTGDDKAISDLMSDWNDVVKFDRGRAKAKSTNAPLMFTKDATPTPEQLRTFQEYSIRQNGRPKVSGTTATMPVLVYSFKTKGDPAALEWSFEKEGDVWRIKTAPLP